MHDARRPARADVASERDLHQPATMNDLLTIGVSKEDLRAFAAGVKLALTIWAVVIVVAAVGLLRMLQ